MEIRAKDFWRHVGKTILMPHPSNPMIMPCKLKIVSERKKKVTLTREDTGTTIEVNYSKDKRKFKVVE